MLLGPKSVQIKSRKPVISICAVRTGCGKSQVTRAIATILQKAGKKVAAIRHPMPYGNLVEQTCQRFEKYEDLAKHKCTIEEMEEYEPHISNGIIVYAGVDYEKILREAEKEADVILWDGGNNDISFYKSDLHVVIADPFRADHELRYHPGETNFRMANVIVINKVNTAKAEDIAIIMKNIGRYNPNAQVIKAVSEVRTEDESMIKGKKVIVVEDGPTLTHGGMKMGAGFVAAKDNKAEIVSPVKYAVGSIKATYEKYPHVKDVLPAMGYGNKQVEELQQTIDNSDVDAIVIGTPIDLGKLIKINKPHTRVYYSCDEKAVTELKGVIKKFL